MTAISLRLPDEVSDRLEKLAGRTGRSKTYYAVEAICRHLEDLEDLYLAETRWRELQEGRSKTIPLEEIVEQYAMEGRSG